MILNIDGVALQKTGFKSSPQQKMDMFTHNNHRITERKPDKVTKVAMQKVMEKTDNAQWQPRPQQLNGNKNHTDVHY